MSVPLPAPRRVFVTGGTGYLGHRLIACLVQRGHRVSALTRAASSQKLPAGCTCLVGNPLDAETFAAHVAPADTFVQLVGTPHPAPWKAKQFREIDLVSMRESMKAAKQARVAHFIYLSVAQPAPIMRAYLAVREWCEIQLKATGLASTIFRPWYILGPGHRWPMVLRPAYRLLELFPRTRDFAQRLGLVTLEEMTKAVVWAVEHPPTGARLLDVMEIRRLGRSGSENG